MPSGEVAAIVVPGNGNPAIAYKTVPFHATAVQPVETGSTRCVHVSPSVEEAEIAVFKSSATNKPAPFAMIASQYPNTGSTPCEGMSAGRIEVPSVGGSR